MIPHLTYFYRVYRRLLPPRSSDCLTIIDIPFGWYSILLYLPHPLACQSLQTTPSMMSDVLRTRCTRYMGYIEIRTVSNSA